MAGSILVRRPGATNAGRRCPRSRSPPPPQPDSMRALGHRRSIDSPRLRHASPTQRRALRHRIGAHARAVPSLVWLATALHVSIMAAYVFLYLPYTNPDEAFHHDIAVAWLNGDGLQEPGERWIIAGLGEGMEISETAYLRLPFTDDDVTPRSQRPTIDELGGNARYAAHPYPNQLTEHPPLYYLLLATVLWTIPGEAGWSWDQVADFLRLINVLLIAPLPLLAWSAVRPLTKSRAVPAAAAMVPLLIPGLSRVGASINNDNLLTLLGATLTVLLVRVCVGDFRPRMTIAVGAVTGLALLTKGFALVFPPVVAVAYFAGWRKAHGRPPIVAALGAQLVAFAIGGWWWVANVVRYGVVQPNGYGSNAYTVIRGPRVPDSVPRSIIEFIDGFAETISRVAVGWLGLLEPPTFPYWLTASIIGILAVGLILAVALRRRMDLSLGVIAIGILPAIGLLLVVAFGSYRFYQWTLLISAAQGRYLYSGLVGLSMVTALGWSGLLPRARRWLPLGLLVVAGTAHFMAAKIVVATFWLPPWSGGTRVGDYDVALAAIARWSPWSAVVTFAPFVGIVVLGPATVACAVLFGQRTGHRFDVIGPTSIGGNSDDQIGEQTDSENLERGEQQKERVRGKGKVPRDPIERQLSRAEHGQCHAEREKESQRVVRQHHTNHLDEVVPSVPPPMEF